MSSAGAIPLNQWTHFACVRAVSLNTIYVNGNSVASDTPTITNATDVLRIGTADAATWFFKGYLQDLRITKGAARYTANFTPPAGRLVAPAFLDYPPLITISGNCIVSGNGGAQLVVIRDVPTRNLAATAIPNATTGAWSATVPVGDYDISYFAPDCQPVCHGPYTVTA